MHESHLRSLVKALSWRILGTVCTMLMIYLLTHKINFSVFVGIVEFIAKTVLFYFHERFWSIISFGKNPFFVKK